MTYSVIGLDISLVATGIAKSTGFVFTSKGEKGDARLDRLYRDVYAVAETARLAVIEDLPMSGHSAALLGNAQGVVKLALYRRGVPYVKVVPSTLKKWVTGSGDASKKDMLNAIPGGVLSAGVFGNPNDDNQVDAYWLRELGLAKLAGKPVPEVVKWDSWTDYL